MSGEDRPFDLAGLSAADKDRLILGLWADLRDERAKARALEARLAEVGGPPPEVPGGSSLLEELRRRGTRKGQGGMATRSVTVRLGRGLGLLRSRAVIGVLAVVVLAFLLDFGLGWYQQRQLPSGTAGGAPAAESRLHRSLRRAQKHRL